MSTHDPSILFSAGLVAGASRGLRQFLGLRTRWGQADQLLRWLWVPGIALFAFTEIFNISTAVLNRGYWLGVFAVFGYLLYSLRAYRPARTLLIAGSPLVATLILESLSELILPTFHKSYEDSFEVAQLFALVWMVVFIGIARREKRTVEAQEAKQLEEARLRAIEEAQKEELERLVSERTATLHRQTVELEKALTDLRATQSQLIQAEKMASLGELTAGIAHEIQNPLNFVNNFAEVSTELLAELKTAQESGDAEEATALADDLTQNLLKIAEHGRRASGIVRGMLEHSRASNGERTPTDLNALADEYLRLAYHGLRAKDKSFNATLKTDFDKALPVISVASADVGRVLLNLFTNAFYAVKKRQQLAEPGYQPTVQVQTRVRPEGGVEVRVRDNGTGIPESVKAKIFQPFFTTKPAGEGTGLGLSLSFDIISKGHGGVLDVTSREGEFTEFSVVLPG
jgi:two-component system, NtrC family, sensor kinase